MASHPPAAAANRIVDVAGCRIALTVAGRGRPALFIHGFGANKITWRNVIPRLADRLTCYAIDLPGHGDTTAPDDFDYSIETVADVVAALASKEDLQNALVVTSSFGSGIALLAAVRSKEFRSRISSLCIIGGACYPQSLPYFVALLRLPYLGALITEAVPPYRLVNNVLKYCYFNDRLITPSQIAGYAEPLTRARVREAIRKTARAIDQKQLERYVPAIKRIRIRCLLIWGENDKVIPLDFGRRLNRDIKTSTLLTIPNCGHIPQEECPDAVVTAIEAFERSLPA